MGEHGGASVEGRGASEEDSRGPEQAEGSTRHTLDEGKPPSGTAGAAHWAHSARSHVSPHHSCTPNLS